MKRVIVGIVVICALAAGCKKYDEGLAFSLRSKKDRIANTWETTEILFDGRAFIFGDQPLVTLKKDGKVIVTGPRINEQGTWSFESNKEKLRFEYPNSSSVLEIKRLTKDELWLFSDDGTRKTLIKYKGLDD